MPKRNNKKIILSFVVLFAVFLAWRVVLKSVPSAFATGGAFPYTKHGGGTVDDLPFSGVDRAVNPDYGAYYNDAAEGGQYLPGECTHCHEPHASFGTTEPAPSTGDDAGPDLYLLMKDYGGNSQLGRNYAELCWYCHENINLNPLYGGGTGFWKFYQGKAVYQAGSHFTSTNFYWPGTSGDPVDIWPRRNRSLLPAGNKGSCLNCHTPHGILETPGSEFDTAAVPTAGPTNLHLAANNPSVSTDYLIPRQLIAWEEALCENCHDASGPSTKDIQSEIDKRIANSGHPVDDTALAGRHVVSEALPITTKHVECYDCHNPHADNASNRLEGMQYIDIDGTVQEPVAGGRQPYIYEVCFKCHGDSYNQVFAADFPFPDTIQPPWGASPAPTHPVREGNEYHFSNKRKEFDPTSHHYMNFPMGDIGYNTSYHPVAAPGRNGTQALFNQLQSAFGLASPADLQTLTIQCTDCHNSEATGGDRGPVTESNLRATDKPSTYTGTDPIGPHGSQRNRLLRGNYLTTNSYSGGHPYSGGKDWYWNNRLDTNGRPKFELCFICHDENVLLYRSGGAFVGTNFGGNGDQGFRSGRYWSSNLHDYHLDARAVCHDCHHNVHSNVEAQNTIYGDGMGGQLPDDLHDDIADGKINTHLINFGPQESGNTAVKPRWYWDGSWFRCNMFCHGANMSLCAYRHGGGSGGAGSEDWCAG